MRLVAHLRSYTESLWLVPGLIAGSLAALAVALLVLDRRASGETFWFAYQGGPGAARDVLAALAGSSITVAALTFSIMIVTLQLVAGQYTPRALRTFLGDRLTQLVAGTFVGLFAYSLLVLRSVRDASGGADAVIPSLAISVGILLGLAALVLLIAFIHHMSRSIQIAEITARIARETTARIATLYPSAQGEEAGGDPDAILAGWRATGPSASVRLERSGFVRAVDLGPLAGLANDGFRVHVCVVPGDFVSKSTVVAEVWPRDAISGDRARSAATAAVVLANDRDLHEDLTFGLRQLADIALRALSPGINDPSTATTCVRHMQDVLERLAATDLPARARHVEGSLLVIRRRTFSDALLPLTDVGIYAADQPGVAETILEALAGVAWAARTGGFDDRVRQVQNAARRLARRFDAQATTDEDRQAIGARVAALEAEV